MKYMKKIMGLVLGVVSIALIVGCQKEEAQAPVEQPMVAEQPAAVEATNMEAAMPAAPAMETTATAVIETAASVIEKPTPQQIQEALKNAGLYDGKIDGSIGPKTKKAIEEFQSQNGLTADGKVGAKTWAKLGTHLGAGAAVVTEPILPADTSATGAASQ